MTTKTDIHSAAIEELTQRKKRSREYLRSLSPIEKIDKLIELQQQYYQMLKIRAENGGRPIPEKWKKWFKARFTC